MVVLLEEGEPVEADHLVRDAICTEEVADGLRHQQDDLRKRLEHTRRPRTARRTIVGRMYVSAPVSSNMITTTVTVNRITPLCFKVTTRYKWERR